jgi:hypothetical protein
MNARLYAINREEIYVVALSYGEAVEKWRNHELKVENDDLEEDEKPKQLDDIDEPSDVRLICAQVLL